MLRRRRRRSGARPHILVMNQYYWPGVEATGQLLADLCKELAREFDVTVVTGKLRDSPNEPRRTRHEGVDIVRVSSTTYDRRRLAARAVNYLSYLVQSFRAGAVLRPVPDVVLCMTDPPVIANVALAVARRARAPLVVVSQDVFPEIAVELKRLESPLVIAVLRRAIGYYLRRADYLVAIGETMRERLIAKGASPERVRVIPNWVDTSSITPQPRDNRWSRDLGLTGRFVVMHSGNVGHAQNLDALIRATTFMRDLDDLLVLIIGSGARHVELLGLADVLETDHVRFLGYQPRELLSESLSSANVHVVGLARGLAGYVVPSRLYGILAAGRPVVVAADAESETARVVERVGCGVVVPPGRPELLAEVLRGAHDGELDLEGMGARGREFVLGEADRTIALSRYLELLREAAGQRVAA